LNAFFFVIADFPQEGFESADCSLKYSQTRWPRPDRRRPNAAAPISRDRFTQRMVERLTFIVAQRVKSKSCSIGFAPCAGERLVPAA
jgi:hypothetical protein